MLLLLPPGWLVRGCKGEGAGLAGRSGPCVKWGAPEWPGCWRWGGRDPRSAWTSRSALHRELGLLALGWGREQGLMLRLQLLPIGKQLLSACQGRLPAWVASGARALLPLQKGKIDQGTGRRHNFLPLLPLK
jgi:hypothetical protein